MWRTVDPSWSIRWTIPRWSLVGAASHDPLEGWIELTPAAPDQAGAAWLKSPVSTGTFSVSFALRIDGHGGADGLAFAWHWGGDTHLGGAGGALGVYPGLASVAGYAVELDSFADPMDSDGNHVALTPFGSWQQGHQVAAELPEALDDGQWHRVVVSQWAATLRVWVDGEHWIDEGPMPAAVDAMTLGFGAATHASYARHLIDDVRICNVDLLDSDFDGHLDVAAGGDDCDDGDPAVYPGAAEIDDDGDSYTECGDPAGDVDCDDADPAVHPGAPQVCDAILDNDCDGVPDADEHGGDGDGVGECGGDCDDSDPGTHPAAAEVCADGVDNDCDGAVDGDDPDCAGDDDTGDDDTGDDDTGDDDTGDDDTADDDTADDDTGDDDSAEENPGDDDSAGDEQLLLTSACRCQPAVGGGPAPVLVLVAAALLGRRCRVRRR